MMRCISLLYIVFAFDITGSLEFSKFLCEIWGVCFKRCDITQWKRVKKPTKPNTVVLTVLVQLSRYMVMCKFILWSCVEQGDTDGPLPMCGDPGLCRAFFHWFGQRRVVLGCGHFCLLSVVRTNTYLRIRNQCRCKQ